jgi:hypothetical protein
VAAERFRIVLPTNFNCDDGLVKVPSPGQSLSEMLEVGYGYLPKCMAKSGFLIHVRHFEQKVWFHSKYSLIAEMVPIIKGFSSIEEEDLGFSRGDSCSLAFELLHLAACQLRPQNACL